MAKKYIRQDQHRFFKLGKNRKKLQKWRRPKGKHSKMRRFRRGYPSRPSIGEKTPMTEAGKIKGLQPVLVHNIKDIQSLTKDSIAIIARVGAKKKMEMLKKADEMGIKIANGGKKQ